MKINFRRNNVTRIHSSDSVFKGFCSIHQTHHTRLWMAHFNTENTKKNPAEQNLEYSSKQQ